MSSSELSNVVLLDVKSPNKRRQLARGIGVATGQIIFLTDDDVCWPKEFVTYMLAGFGGNTKIGAVGSFHDAVGLHDPSIASKYNMFEAVSARRLWLDNNEIAAANYIDGTVTVLSGRTAAYRSSILKADDFIYQFTNELWLGRYRLNSGDDQFITRWVLSHGWQINIQAAPEATIETSVHPNTLILAQWLRWERNTLRSYTKRLLFSPHNCM